MTAAFTRDAAATAAIFGFFASSWFGWAQEQPPASWRTALGEKVGWRGFALPRRAQHR